jgi:FkbM family methyltransferase
MDTFEKYSEYYSSPVKRPQPSDFTLEYFKDKGSVGFFVDVGAHDGITWSNTLALSELMHWAGICIEANLDVYARLVANRTSDRCINVGLHDSDGDLLFYKIDGYPEMLSGFVSDYDDEHVQRIHREIEQHGGTIEEVLVKTQRLSSVIKEYDITTIDYLSVDVEGAELAVLSGLDININRPQLISIEDNGYHSEPHTFLVEHEYRFLQKVEGDRFYEDSLL